MGGYGESDTKLAVSHFQSIDDIKTVDIADSKSNERNEFESEDIADAAEPAPAQSTNAEAMQYIYDEATLSALNAPQIASMLVPKRKLWKRIYKEWMKLIIRHKAEVVAFLFHSVANQTHSDFKYIPVPDCLRALDDINEEGAR